MPKKVEKALSRQARKEGLTGKEVGAYVYGTMEKEGLMPKRRKRKK
jgi:hypothetical protein